MSLEKEYCHECSYIGTEGEPLVRVAYLRQDSQGNLEMAKTDRKIHIGCWLFRQSQHIEDAYIKGKKERTK